MSHNPPVPPAQRSPGPQAAAGQDPNTEAAGSGGDAGIGRRDAKTGLQSSEPGDGDVNLEQQGRQGDIHQNTTHQGHQQDR